MSDEKRASQELTPVSPEHRLLTREEFQGLADVPAELEWFASIDNPNTRRAYIRDVKEFMRFTGIVEPEEFRDVTRAHIIAWRKQLEARELAAATIRPYGQITQPSRKCRCFLEFIP